MASEVRRLRGVRATWVVVAAAVVLNAAVAAFTAIRLPAGELATADAVRSVAAVVPVLPLPLTALAAAVLGALAYGNETRWPGLPASRVTLGRRLSALLAKSLVVGAAAVLLAVVTLGLNALVARLALPAAVDASTLLDPAGLPAAPFATGGIGRPLAAFLVLAVAGGWAGLLITSLVRSAVVGILLTCALPALLEPTSGLLLHRTGRNWPVWVRELMPFQYGLDLVRSAADRTAGALDGVVVAALLAPAALLVLAAVLAQLRRRSL
ncbi:hypothetical protein HUT16_25070 [Kitasatospora sp. NA04385]|uniref:hypothetical protein n=1 Tax=Kitasatospora sp. NA04385 TaxID=2742135 RepID=UPI00158FFC5C|nr:hypothetical protein [Kitasatospora sp. NA04385]QKW21894.1 hypothetical protein HUT16_25070 [Kitasatospora sp. NA04385]